MYYFRGREIWCVGARHKVGISEGVNGQDAKGGIERESVRKRETYRERWCREMDMT